MRIATLIIIGLGLLCYGCSNRKIVKETDLGKPPVATPAANTSGQSWLWEYSGEKGPAKWSTINSEYQLCASGSQQSPINLKWRKPMAANSLTIQYAEGDVIISNTGYTYRLEFTPQSRITFKGQEYILEKAEFRTPSEHQLSGHAMPIEIQFYHRSTNGLRQVVLSIFAVAGRQSPWFENLWKVAKDTGQYKTSPTIRMNPGVLVPPRKTFYNYQGSLTHPPCLEGVEWLVFNTPIQLSIEQIAELRASYNNNNRPLQPLNGRPVTNY